MDLPGKTDLLRSANYKRKFWITLVICLAWCIDRVLYKAIDYHREQGRLLVELQDKQNKQIRLNNNQRMRVGILPIAHLLTCQSSMKGILELPNLRVLSVRIHVSILTPQGPSFPNRVRKNVDLWLKEAFCKEIFCG